MKYRSGRPRRVQIYINLVLGVIAFALFVYYWSEFKTAVYPAIEPFMRGYGGAKRGVMLVPESVFSYFSSRNGLIARNRDLELDIERLENMLAEKEADLRELALATGMDLPDNGTRNVILYPIAGDKTKVYSTQLLSKGFREGIEEGGIVYLRGLQPVCQIVEVYDHTSLCELLSRGGRETSAVTASSSIVLVLRGAGGGSFVAELPKGSVVSVGEEVFLQSDTRYKVGAIVSVQDDEQATGATVYVRGAYNPVTSSVFYLNTRYAP